MSTQQVIMSAIITEPSICIPRTLNNVTRQQVKEVFETVIGRGTVERVDIVANKQNDGQPFCRIFVHFRYWPNSAEIMSIRQRLLDGEMIKVVYDNPWFWKCSASRVPKPTNSRPKTTPFIGDFGEVRATPFIGEFGEVRATPSPVPEEVAPVAPVAPVALHGDGGDSDSDPNGVESEDDDGRSPSPSPIRRAASRANREETSLS